MTAPASRPDEPVIPHTPDQQVTELGRYTAPSGHQTIIVARLSRKGWATQIRLAAFRPNAHKPWHFLDLHPTALQAVLPLLQRAVVPQGGPVTR